MMHDVERIACLLHVQTRQVAPRTADRIERLAPARFQKIGLGQRLAGYAHCLSKRTPGHIMEAQAPKRQCDPLPDLFSVHLDQFQAAATEVADYAARRVETGNDPAGRIAGLFPP